MTTGSRTPYRVSQTRAAPSRPNHHVRFTFVNEGGRRYLKPHRSWDTTRCYFLLSYGHSTRRGIRTPEMTVCRTVALDQNLAIRACCYVYVGIHSEFPKATLRRPNESRCEDSNLFEGSDPTTLLRRALIPSSFIGKGILSCVSRPWRYS